MATTKAAKKTSPKKAAPKKRSGSSDPAKAISDAARDLEREVMATVRAEIRHLAKSVESIQREVHDALMRVEAALDLTPAKKRAKAAGKKAPAKRAAARSTPKKRIQAA